MEFAVVIKGRLVGPRTVKLEEPLPDGVSTVQVIARLEGEAGQRLHDCYRSLLPGSSGTEGSEERGP